MALATIQDILSTFPGWFTLDLECGDETSGQGSGIYRVKKLRPDLWVGSGVSRWLTPNEVRYWKAKLFGLDNGQSLFYGRDFTSCYPTNYPNGAWPTGGSFDGVSAAVHALPDGKTVQLENLPPGFSGAVGDMIQATRAGDSVPCLYQAMESFLANGSGVTGSFEVRPAIRTGQAVDDVVAVKNPSVVMALVPGSVQVPDGVAAGVITFKARQAQ